MDDGNSTSGEFVLGLRPDKPGGATLRSSLFARPLRAARQGGHCSTSLGQKRDIAILRAKIGFLGLFLGFILARSGLFAAAAKSEPLGLVYRGKYSPQSRVKVVGLGCWSCAKLPERV